MLLAEDFEHFEVPANFADKVMLSIEDSRNQADWFESLGQIVSRFMEIPIVQYASLVTGFSAGIISFIRFVAFVFSSLFSFVTFAFGCFVYFIFNTILGFFAVL